MSEFRPCKTFRKHQIITSHVYLETRCLIRCPISALSDAVEVMKLDRRTSKTMLQEENDIKDVVAASSSKPKFGFHSKIHQYLQTPPPTMPHQEMAPKAPPLLSIQTKYLEGLSPMMSVGWYHNPKERSSIGAEGPSLHR